MELYSSKDEIVVLSQSQKRILSLSTPENKTRAKRFSEELQTYPDRFQVYFTMDCVNYIVITLSA